MKKIEEYVKTVALFVVLSTMQVQQSQSQQSKFIKSKLLIETMQKLILERKEELTPEIINDAMLATKGAKSGFETALKLRDHFKKNYTLTFDSILKNTIRTIVEVFRDKKDDCSGISELYCRQINKLFEIQKSESKAFLVEVNSDSAGRRMDHVCVGILLKEKIPKKYLYRDEKVREEAIQRFGQGNLILLNPLGEIVTKYRKIRLLNERQAKALHLTDWARTNQINRDYESAVARATKAIELDPGNIRAYRILAECLIEQKCYDEAESVIAKGQRWNFQNMPDLVFAKGRLAFEKGNCSEAEKLFREAIALDPTWERPYLFLKITLDILGKKKESERVFKKYKELERKRWWP